MKAAAAEGIETVIEAVNKHMKNKRVCKWGFDVLWSIVKDNGKTNLLWPTK